MRDKNKPRKKLKDKSITNKIIEKKIYKHICLEYCNINNSIRGREEAILKTLKDFSDVNKLNSRNIHSLNKSNKLEKYYKICNEHNTDKLYSVDIEGRTSKYRMLFCKSDIERVYKILSLCTDETH